MKNSIYNLIGAVIRLVAGLLTIPILIQNVGIKEYGLWTLVSSAIGVITLAEGGLAISTTVFLARDLADGDEEGLSQTLTVVSAAMLCLAGAAALLMWLGAGILISYFPSLDDLQKSSAIQAIQFGAVVVWAKLLQQIMVGIEQAYQQYGLINIVHTIQFFFTNIGLLFIAHWGGKSIELMQWTASIALVTITVHLIISFRLLKSRKIRLSWDRIKSREIARYSMFNWLSQLGGTMFSQGDRLIVGGILGTEVLGLYAAITNITYQINYLSGLAVQPLLPLIASKYQQIKSSGENPTSLKDQIEWGFQLNAAVALGTGIVILSVVPWIGKLIIGSYFTSSQILPFQIATIIYSLYSLNAAGYFTLMATNSVNTCTIFQLVSGFLSLILMYLGAAQFGLIGAIIGNAGFLLTLGLNTLATQQIVGQKFIWVQWLYFPLIIFSISVIVNILIGIENISLNFSLIAINLVMFCSYFYIKLKPNLQSQV